MLDWIDLGRRAFVDPFFRDTILRRMRHSPRPQRTHTEVEVLRTLHERGRATAPAGFVFHVSRCGSTLVARMLAASRRSLVLSEADPVNSLLINSSGVCRPDLLLRSLLDRVMRHFGVRPEQGQVERAARLLDYDSKSRGRTRRFQADAEEKRRAASGELVALTERWLRRPDEELERRRARS